MDGWMEWIVIKKSQRTCSNTSHGHAGHEASVRVAEGEPGERGDVGGTSQGQKPAGAAAVEQHAGGRGEEAVEEAEEGRDPRDVGLGVICQQTIVPVRLEEANGAQEAICWHCEAETAYHDPPGAPATPR